MFIFRRFVTCTCACLQQIVMQRLVMSEMPSLWPAGLLDSWDSSGGRAGLAGAVPPGLALAPGPLLPPPLPPHPPLPPPPRVPLLPRSHRQDSRCPTSPGPCCHIQWQIFTQGEYSRHCFYNAAGFICQQLSSSIPHQRESWPAAPLSRNKYIRCQALIMRVPGYPSHARQPPRRGAGLMQLHSTARIHQNEPKHMSKNQRPSVQLHLPRETPAWLPHALHTLSPDLPMLALQRSGPILDLLGEQALLSRGWSTLSISMASQGTR